MENSYRSQGALFRVPSNVISSTRAELWSCLRIPGLHLPKEGMEFAVLLLQLLIVHTFIQSFYRLLFSRVRLTPIATQMWTGLFLSPFTLLSQNQIYRIPNTVIFPHGFRNIDESISMISYMMYTFLIAVKLDFSIVMKTGQKAFVIGILDSVVPFAVDLWFLFYQHPKLFFNLGNPDQITADMYINLMTLPLTHFPNIAVLLADLKMTNSELGRLALSSSIIGHILSLFILAIGNVATRGITDPIQLITPFGLIFISVVIIRPILNWVIRITPKGRPVYPVCVHFGILIMYLGALTTQFADQLIILGAFVVGAVIPNGPPLGSAVVDKLDFFASTLLLPFFVTTAVMGGEYRYLHRYNHGQIVTDHIVLALIAYLAKFINGLVCGLLGKMAFTDALALGFIMSTKGIVDVGALIMFRELDVLSTPSYTVMLYWILMVTTITPFCVRCLYHPHRKYAGYQRRDIMHCKYNSELRILACFFRSNSVSSMTRFLDVCCPSEMNPIAVYALHLVKMVGRAQPIFISHNTQKIKALSNSFSEDVVWAFFRFEERRKSFLSASVFTSVSPSDMMHEDTCTLALDKLASIIVLPFHRNFRLDGSIDYEDNEQRIINSDLLSRSPCSVAIFVDRGTFGKVCTTSVNTADSSSLFMVAVVYIGGIDDQETLSFAKRIGRDARISVCVIRLVTFGQTYDLDPLDSAALMDIQTNDEYNKKFTYIERTVRDGADTATFLNYMVESYNLVMVGRSYHFACAQLIGLNDMSEETELGAIGDFLASEDMRCRTSVLVVQQQRLWAFK